MEKFLFKNCDYRILLNEIKDLEIQIKAVITDPPYGVSRKNQLGLGMSRKVCKFFSSD